MFKSRGADGRLNLCGEAVAERRKALGLSQKKLADQLQLLGIDIGKNAVQQIESGTRFVTDIELKALAEFFGTTMDSLTP